MAPPSLPGNDAVSTNPGPDQYSQKNLVEAELIASISWLIRLRWLAGLGVITASFIVKYLFHLAVPVGILSALGAAILFYNLLLSLSERQFHRHLAPTSYYTLLAKWQTGLDWVAMILLIHFSGGIESPAILFFIFHIIIASIFFSRATAYFFSCMAIVLVTGMALLEYYRVIPHEAVVGFLEQPLYQNGWYVAGLLVFFSSTSLISAYLVGSIHTRLRLREQEIIELTENLQRATVRLQALNDGARIVGSTLELKQVLERLANSTAEVMRVSGCSIRLLDKSHQQLESVAFYGLSQAYQNKGPIDAQGNPITREVLTGKVVNIPNVPESTLLQYPQEARQEGIGSILSAPLQGKAGPLGIIRAYAMELNRFNPEDEAFLGAIAAQGSIAIENAMAYQAIQELDALKSQFIRMVTHELRSPVSVTRSLLRTIVAGYAGEISQQQGEILERASRRVEFLQKLIDDLLDLAAGKVQLTTQEDLKPLPLADALQIVIERYMVPVQEKKITLEWSNLSLSKPLQVMSTAEGLDRVFNNLVSNAVKYTPNGGKVTVELSQKDVEAQVVTADTGIGIPQEALGHLFEEFYRAPNAKDLVQEGTGLGLAIVKDIVTKYGGRIVVQSELNIGTRIIVSLPLVGE